MRVVTRGSTLEERKRRVGVYMVVEILTSEKQLVQCPESLSITLLRPTRVQLQVPLSPDNALTVKALSWIVHRRDSLHATSLKT